MEEEILAQLQRIEKKLDALLGIVNAKEEHIMSALTDLQAQVEKNTSVEASAVTLIQGLAAEIAAAAANSDTAALQALSAELNTSATALAAAVTANTPAAPTQPAPAT